MYERIIFLATYLDIEPKSPALQETPSSRQSHLVRGATSDHQPASETRREAHQGRRKQLYQARSRWPRVLEDVFLHLREIEREKVVSWCLWLCVVCFSSFCKPSDFRAQTRPAKCFPHEKAPPVFLPVWIRVEKHPPRGFLGDVKSETNSDLVWSRASYTGYMDSCFAKLKPQRALWQYRTERARVQIILVQSTALQPSVKDLLASVCTKRPWR